MVFFEKIIVYISGKFWDGQNLAICGQNLAIFGQNWQFWEFYLELPNDATNLPDFGMEVVVMVFFEKIMLYMPGKFWYVKIWPFKAKILPFLAKIDSFESCWPITSKRRYDSFLIFGMEVVLRVLFEKIILYMQGKFWYGKILAI